MERMRAIRQVDARHHFTLVCRDLSEISHYARVDNRVYRMLKATTPGQLHVHPAGHSRSPATPAESQAATPSACAFRIIAVVQALLAELDEPLLSSTLMLPGDELPLNDAAARSAPAWSTRSTWYWTGAPAASR